MLYSLRPPNPELLTIAIIAFCSTRAYNRNKARSRKN